MGSGAGQNQQAQQSYTPGYGIGLRIPGQPYSGMDSGAGMGGAPSQMHTGGAGQQYGPPNWWVPGGGGQQQGGGQPLWTNPFSPMGPGDWAALREQYYPTVSLPPKVVPIHQAFLRGGESEMSDAIDATYGSSPNPGIFADIAAAVQDTAFGRAITSVLGPEAFAVTSPASSARSRMRAADPLSSFTPGAIGRASPALGGYGVIGNTGGEGGHNIYGRVPLGSSQDMTGGRGIAFAGEHTLGLGTYGAISGVEVADAFGPSVGGRDTSGMDVGYGVDMGDPGDDDSTEGG